MIYRMKNHPTKEFVAAQNMVKYPALLGMMNAVTVSVDLHLPKCRLQLFFLVKIYSNELLVSRGFLKIERLVEYKEVHKNSK